MKKTTRNSKIEVTISLLRPTTMPEAKPMMKPMKGMRSFNQITSGMRLLMRTIKYKRKQKVPVILLGRESGVL